MKRLWVIALILFAPGIAQAQTDTPTPTPTPTATPTAIPETRTLIPVGAVIPWAGNFTPEGWLVADGSCVAQETYSELYAALGDVYTLHPYGETCIQVEGVHCCGEGEFGLPHLAGRVIVGAGIGAGLTVRAPGDLFGEETHILTIDEMPSHRHAHSTSTTSGGSFFARGTGGGTTYGGYAGGDQPHNIMQPSLVLSYIIWTGTVTLELGESIMYPTWTPEPLISVYSTVEAGGYAQPVAFTYQVTAGDLMVSVLLLIGIGVGIIQLAFKVWGDKR